MVGDYFKVDGKVCRVIQQHRHGVFTLKRVHDEAIIERVGSELHRLTDDERIALVSHGAWSMLTSYVP